MPHRPSRRRLLQTSTVAALSAWVAPRGSAAAESSSPNEKLNIGVIGVANRGGANLAGVSSQNIVAICDVDDRYLAAAAAKDHPRARRFNDFRKMLDDMKELDAVVVSTADHCHAAATVRALRMGKHVYCEKPLTHTVAEARLVAAEAAKAKRATQMGTQIHAGDNYRRVVEILRSGAIGAIRRVHVFVRSHYASALKRSPDAGVNPPPEFHWDLWLGPAAERPYKPLYHPQQWRFFWDFGGGTLGDFGCHHLDLSFWALNLRHPTAVTARGPAPDPLRPPEELEVDYDFAARGDQPPVQITWAHGDKRPKVWDELGAPKWGNGSLFVGDRGLLVADYGKYQLLPADRFKDFTPPAQSIPKSLGHHEEWIKACKDGSPTLCNFDYGAALTETALLGNVAHRAGNKRLEWEATNARVTNLLDANAFLTREYRKGWEI